MPTSNQNLNARSFQPEFKAILQAVFRVQSYFRDFFAGGIEALDGVTHNETAFYVKTSDIPVVVGNEYLKGANVAFGTGTSSSTRFGPRTEIIYVDTPVPYTWEWVFHEGIDRHTVNNNLNSAVADRLELQAQAKTRTFNRHHSDFIASIAGHSETLDAYTDEAITALFDALSAHFVNIEAVGALVAKVNTSIYNTLVNGGLMVREKGSTVNIDGNELPMFKGFGIQQIPDDMFNTTDGGAYAAYAYIANVGKAFTGINTARTIESEDFDGQALQGAGKAGEFILDDNKIAVVTVEAPPMAP